MSHTLQTWQWAAATVAKAALRPLRSADAPTDGTDLEPWIGAALAWLVRSQDESGSDGSSKAWHLWKGWLPAYPETTGYLIPTLYDAAAVRGEPEYAARALRMARWELGVQLPNGAWPGDHVATEPRPIVFNTGQVLFGVLRAHAETGDREFLDAARRAGDFLASIQDEDGAWRRHTFADIPHAYHARVAWPMLLLARATGDERYATVARRNLAWVMSRQNDAGWFAENHFLPGTHPNTHGVAYVTQSLVEAGEIDGNLAWIAAARRANDRLVGKLDRRGFIAGRHDEHFADAALWECVTGNIQAAITALRLHQVTGDRAQLDAGLRLLAHARRAVSLDHPNPGVRGAVPGSFPFIGRYAPVQFPNWATKFFVDALLLAQALARRRDGHALGGHAVVLETRYNG